MKRFLFCILVVMIACSAGYAAGPQSKYCGTSNCVYYGSYMVNDNGDALLVTTDYVQEEKRYTSIVTISAFNSLSGKAWELTLDDYANYFLWSYQLNGNDLLLALHSGFSTIIPMVDDTNATHGGFSGSTGNDSNTSELSVTLLCLDSTTGKTKWTLDMDSTMSTIAPAPNGYWFVEYSGFGCWTYEQHLTSITDQGQILWDEITYSFDVGPGAYADANTFECPQVDRDDMTHFFDANRPFKDAADFWNRYKAR